MALKQGDLALLEHPGGQGASGVEPVRLAYVATDGMPRVLPIVSLGRTVGDGDPAGRGEAEGTHTES